MCRVVGVFMAVPAMHEQVQHGAQEEQDIRECAKDMRPVFREKKKCGNGKKREQHQPARRPHPTMLLGWIIGGHRFLLCCAQ